MTVLDPAFEGVGQEAGIVIWRIEQMEVKPIPKSEYGNFFNGDSYIVLSTKVTKSGRFEWDIHFWLGEETSQDEAGAAAIKTVELDDSLGGSPVQHREVQEHESSLFLSYFKKGIRYLKGGVKSGFRHVEDESVKRLLRVKGRRNVRLHEMPIEIGSLNSGDCFVLDSAPNVFLFVGTQSGRMERIKAIQAANAIRDDVHHGKSIVKIIDSNSSNSEIQEFFDDLGGGSLDDVADASAGGDDAAFESGLEKKLALYRIWEDDSGDLQFELVGEKPLKQEYLQSGDCYMLDTGINGLFVWIGKESSQKERREAMNIANKYIEKKSYPKWLPVKRIIDQGEPPLFKSNFSSWTEPDDQMGLGKIYTLEEIAASFPGEDLSGGVGSLNRKKRVMFSKSVGKACGFMPDDGSGSTEIWRVENFDIVPLESSQHGIFFGGDSYIIKYTYNNKGGSERYILYFWQGQTSTLDERATSAIMTVKIDNEQLGGKAIQVRVVHGQEPEHFLRIFKGKMVIMSGGKASGFRNIHDFDSYDADGTRLFQVRGTNEYNTRAEQVPETSSSLNSNDVFILETPSVTYLWTGKESNDEEKEMGKKIIDIVSPGREIVEIAEGEEPDEFWAKLGGKGDYANTRELPSRPVLEPRLFKFSNETGKFITEEICNFTQEDLAEDDVMVLDSGDALYIWIGKGANEDEKQKSLEMAEEYIQSDPTDRSFKDTLVITIKQTEEPEVFKSYFGQWNPDLWDELSALLVRN